jgi:2-keto-4-pentenoate hydratase/2-oxohepta-3-ene-1,7-dioic acid hydratase in catechol pathway
VKLGRFLWSSEVVYGVVEGDQILSISGDIFGQFEPGGELCKTQDVRFLPPVEPRTVIGIGINYPKRVEQHYSAAPEEEPTKRPVLFLMPTSSIIGHSDPIILPVKAKHVDAAAELVVVMKRRAKAVSEDEAGDYILGYSCGNDLAAPDLHDDMFQTLRVHGFDTATAIGPYVETAVPPEHLAIDLKVNGDTVVTGNTADMIYGVNMIVSYITQFMTLYPGDVIFMGTPLGAPVGAGDVVEVDIEGIGTLSNEVMSAG